MMTEEESRAHLHKVADALHACQKELREAITGDTASHAVRALSLEESCLLAKTLQAIVFYIPQVMDMFDSGVMFPSDGPREYAALPKIRDSAIKLYSDLGQMAQDLDPYNGPHSRK
jgi:hypothetical protein